MNSLAKLEKWRVLCVDEDSYQIEWRLDKPTECPNDPNHTIIHDKTGFMLTEIPFIRLTPRAKIKNSNFTNLATIYFDPTDYLGTLRRLVVVSYRDSNIETYEVELFDATNNVQLISASNDNQNLEVRDIGVIENPPSSPVILEVNIKNTSFNGKKGLSYINEIIFYGSSEN